MTVEHISFSQVSKADACLSYWMATRGAVADVPSGPRDVGILTHKIIETYLTEYAQGETIEDAAYAGLVAAGSSTYAFEESKALFERWKSRFALAREAIVGIEHAIEARIEGVGVPLVGYVDLVYLDRDENDRTVLVARDFKTGWSSDVTADYEFQGDLMCLGLEAQFPGMRLASEVEFVRSGIVARRVFTDAHREAALARVRRSWERMDDARMASDGFDLPRTPGKHCGYCPIAPECAERALAEKQGDVITIRFQADLTLRRIAQFEAAAKRLKESLRTYVGDHGPFEAGGLSASFSATETIGCKDTAALVERVGLERAADFLTVDGRKKAVKALKADPAFADLFGVTARRNEFKIGGKLEEPGAADDAEVDVA